jgi:cobaltochelatase CobT
MAGEAFLAIVLIAVLAFAFYKSRKTDQSAQAKFADDPGERPYYPFSTDFDVVCTGSELIAVLAENAVDARPAQAVGSLELTERTRQFDEAYASVGDVIEVPRNLGGTAIFVLLDQSGSMAERMPRIAGQLLAALNAMEASGASTMFAGFTTVGWRGGRSRRQWIAKGRPSYPGRLCDLLHVVYSKFSVGTTAAQLSSLLQPAVCFENVDGEAIIWAEHQLLSSVHPKRLLIVVSDGAPVDDSTLTENGLKFLWKHLELVVNDCLERCQIGLGAVGIDHRVDSLYPVARVVDAEGAVGQAIVDVAVQLAEKTQASSDDPGNATSPS